MISNQSSVRRTGRVCPFTNGLRESLCYQTFLFVIRFKNDCDNCAVVIASPLAHHSLLHKSTILKLTTVQFVNELGLAKKRSVHQWVWLSLSWIYLSSLVVSLSPKTSRTECCSIMLFSPTWRASPSKWVAQSAHQLIQLVVQEKGRRSISFTCTRSKEAILEDLSFLYPLSLNSCTIVLAWSYIMTWFCGRLKPHESYDKFNSWCSVYLMQGCVTAG